jgi:hypothetical protein
MLGSRPGGAPHLTASKAFSSQRPREIGQFILRWHVALHENTFRSYRHFPRSKAKSLPEVQKYG